MKSQSDVREALLKALPAIESECGSVLASELHYQAMVYHCLREKGRVPVRQLGMNVKMGIYGPRSKYWRKRASARAEDYRGHCEPIPDIAFFRDGIEGDWRRRRHEESFKHLIGVVEVKASERNGSRLRPREIISDIEKIAAHREERVHAHGRGFYAAVMVIDTAPKPEERMNAVDLERVRDASRAARIDFFYIPSGPSKL